MAETGKLTNHEVVTIAVYALGGDLRDIDIEDIAVKAHELAPGRFAWRKYPEQINIEAVRKRLWDARNEAKGGYVIGSDRHGWRLTAAGLAFVQAQGDQFGPAPPRQRQNRQEQHWRAAERARLLASPALAVFLTGGAGAVPQREAEAFFRIDDYVTGRNRQVKVDRLVHAFGTDPTLGPAVHQLASRIPGGSDDTEQR